MPIVDDKEGKLCEYRDYVKLEAENARLQDEVERLTRKLKVEDNNAQCLEMVINAGTANELRLKAEVERLTEAGEHLWAFAQTCVLLNTYPKIAQERINIWNAAKEGKPSV